MDEPFESRGQKLAIGNVYINQNKSNNIFKYNQIICVYSNVNHL